MTELDRVGYPGDLLHCDEADVVQARAGGAVCIWNDVPADALEQVAQCNLCKRALALVLQVQPFPQHGLKNDGLK
jgi:hypothetical protein